MPYLEHFLLEAIKFAAFVFACGSLMRFRFNSKITGLAAAGALLAILVLQAGLLLAGLDETLVLTLLPVTAYLPAILAVHGLSGSGFLPTVSVWSAGVLLSFSLLFLQRLVNLWLPRHTVALVLAAAAALCALAFRFLRRPYRVYVLETLGGWLLLSFPAVMLFLLFSYWANTVTDPVLLLLILLTALSLMGVMAWGLASAASLRRPSRRPGPSWSASGGNMRPSRRSWTWAGSTAMTCVTTSRCWRGCSARPSPGRGWSISAP